MIATAIPILLALVYWNGWGESTAVPAYGGEYCAHFEYSDFIGTRLVTELNPKSTKLFFTGPHVYDDKPRQVIINPHGASNFLGDINGDGFDDIFLGDRILFGGRSWMREPEPHVGYEQQSQEMNGINGFSLYMNGLPILSSLGGWHATAAIGVGDINRDGLADWGFGATKEFTLGKTTALGFLRVVYGNATIGASGSLDLLDTVFSGGFIIYNDNFSPLTFFVGYLYQEHFTDFAGPDLDGDSWTDLVIGDIFGVSYEHGRGYRDDGTMLVVMGRPNMESLHGVTVTELIADGSSLLYGLAEPNSKRRLFGMAVLNFNGDIYQDVVYAKDREVQLLLGHPQWQQKLYSRSSLSPLVVQSSCSSLSPNAYVFSIATADYNSDGFDDIAVVCVYSYINEETNSALFIIWGSLIVVDLSRTSSRHLDMVRIRRDIPGSAEYMGRHISFFDMNGDGYKELAINIPYSNDFFGGNTNGRVAVLFHNLSYAALASDINGSQGFNWDASSASKTVAFFIPGYYDSDDYEDLFVVPYFSQAQYYVSSNIQASYFFWGWNLHFTFLNNRLEVNEGETVNMATLLGALSCRVAPEQVYFTITALQNGRFEFTTKPGQAITTFSQANLSAGLVRFVHPGGDLEPSYNVTASDGQYTLTEPAKIDFNFQRPFFILNQLAVREGETVVLTSAMVTVGDGDSSPSEILIQVSSLEEGIFSALSFTYALLLAGSVSFTHSGSEFPPRFSLSLSDGIYTEAACPTKISFTNVNDAPTILKNQFTINEGQALTLTSSDLSATDPDDDDRSLTFQVVTALHCFFQRASGPGVPIVSFTQGDVQDGTIKVVHDGSELFPLVALRVVDAQQAASSSKASVITFSNLSDPPFFLNAEVNITEGETLVLSASMLSASDVDNNDINLIFTVEAATYAYFRVASSSVSSPVTSFLQKFILEGRVSLVHDGSEGVPNITLTVSDGGWSSPPRQLQVHFTDVDDPPVFLSRPQLALIEGQSKTLSNLEFMVWDDDTPDTAVILALENTQRCSFYVNNTQVTSFPLFYLNHGWVSIIPDGSSFAPQFEVTVGDATTVSLPLSALVAFTPVNDFPVLVRNLLIIAQGGSVLIGSSQLEASDEETAFLQLLFSVTNLRAGQFKKNGQSVHTFLQAELVAGAIWFVHDNSEVPPSYDVIVSDGAALSVPSPVQVTFTQVNDAPYLINNALTIEEGQTVQITSDQLKAADPEQGAAGSLLFSVSNVLHLQFYYYNQSQTALTSFFQDEVLNGSVFATHDGSNYAPSYMLQVSDGATSSGPQKCTVAFSARNDVPVIVRNVLFIAEGGKAVLGTANLEASDEETAFAQLRFSVIDARAGWFETGGLTVSSFTQQQLAAGYVSFVHDGSEQAPSYEIVVSDGSSLSAPSPVQVTFTQVNDAPYLINNALTIEEGQTVQITSDQLKAADPEQGAAGSLLFSVSNVLHLQFYYYNQSQTALTSFLQGDVFNGSVLATHDGSDNVPSYMLQVSDGAASSPSQSALVSFVPVPDPPVLEANLLFIAQRQRISVSSLQLRATDPDSPSNRILFDILDLLHGRFERLGVFGVPIVTFSMQDVSAGVIFFEHDGSEVAPSYWVAVSDGTTTLPPSLALVDYANVNDPPTLVHNSFIITEGQTMVVTINMLQGTDPDDDDEDILVEISESKQINFFQVAEPALSILSFSQADILAGQILLSHDGSDIPPAFRFTFIDPHGAASATVPAAVEFVAVNDPPVLTRNTLTIAEGERLVLSQDELAASDHDNHEQDLLFTVEHVVAGQFERLGNPGLAIFRFEQLRVMKGDIIFVAQGNVLPSYNVSVSDGTNATEPSAAIVRFTSLKALAASESMQDRVKNTIIISTISGVVGILFFLFQLYLQYQYQKRFEEGDVGEDPQDKEYYRGVVIPVAQEVFRCMRIKGPFGMISAEDFAAYLGSVRALLTHLSSLEVDIFLPNMNPARRDAFLNEIAYQTLLAVLRDRKKTCLSHFLLPCTYCLPEHPPEWIRENAPSIARAVAQALTLGSPQLKRTHSAHSSHSILGPGAKVAPKPLPPLIISSDSGQPASSGEPPALALSSSARAAEVPVEVKRKGPRSSWPPTHGGGEPEVHWADLEEMERHHRADLEEMKTTIIHLVEEAILAMETKERLLKLGITLQGAMKPSQTGYEPGHHDDGYAYRKPNQNSSPSDPTRVQQGNSTEVRVREHQDRIADRFPGENTGD